MCKTQNCTNNACVVYWLSICSISTESRTQNADTETVNRSMQIFSLKVVVKCRKGIQAGDHEGDWSKECWWENNQECVLLDGGSCSWWVTRELIRQETRITEASQNSEDKITCSTSWEAWITDNDCVRDWSSCVGSDKVIRTRWGADQEHMWLKPHPRRIIGWQNTEVGRTEGESKEWRKKDHIRSNDTDVFHNLFFYLSCFYVFWCRHAFRWLLTHFHPCIIKTIQFGLILLVIMNRGSRFYFWHVIVLACELNTHDR